jgi:hypothetical protein
MSIQLERLIPGVRWISFNEIEFDRNTRGDRIEIGNGSFATVLGGNWRNTPVAVKAFMLESAALLENRIIREVNLQSRLEHENVMAILAVYLDETTHPNEFGIVMPRMDIPLDKLLHNSVHEPVPLLARLEVSYQVSTVVL